MSLQAQPVSAKANALGIAVATLPTVPLGATWTVSQVTVSTNSTNSTQASLTYSGQPLDQTTSGNNDTAGGDPPVTVTQKDSLVVTWTGCNAGDICNAVFYYTY